MQVRAFANKDLETFFNESMHIPPDTPPETIVVRKRQSMWHSEMYGYGTPPHLFSYPSVVWNSAPSKGFV